MAEDGISFGRTVTTAQQWHEYILNRVIQIDISCHGGVSAVIRR
jgi:hypothetical protein